MNAEYAAFYSAGISTHLGFGIEENLQALSAAPTAAQTHHCLATGETIEFPYKFLKQSPPVDDIDRLYAVLHQIIDHTLDEANLSATERRATNVYIGSSSFDIAAKELAYSRDLKEARKQTLALRSPSFGKIADRVVGDLGITGQDFSFNTACTASANALLTAATHIKLGLTRHALVIGVELYNNISVLGFHGLSLFTKSGMKPFDKDRDGLVLGEGVSAVLLGPCTGERGEFYLAGSATNCDTYGISSPQPNGTSIATVMQLAIDHAKLTPEAISAIKAHGTASLLNDEAEAAGMFSLFDSLPPVCALKPYLGHTLGACGLNELILFYHSVKHGFLPATPGICPEPSDLNIQLNQSPSPIEQGNFLLNYFGFGGNNVSLVISNIPRC